MMSLSPSCIFLLVRTLQVGRLVDDVSLPQLYLPVGQNFTGRWVDDVSLSQLYLPVG